MGRRGGTGYRNTVHRLSRVERHHRLVGLRRGAEGRGEHRREQAQGPREKKPGWGRSPRAGPRGQSQADARGCPVRGRRPLAPAPCPSLVLARNRGGKESRKKSQQGRGFQSNKCPRRPPKRLLVRGRKAKHGEAASWPSSFSPCPTALTLPHDALQPPFRHRRRHLPNTAEKQPPPPTRNLL